MPHFSVLCITGTQQGKQRPYPQSARYHSSSDGHGITRNWPTDIKGMIFD